MTIRVGDQTIYLEQNYLGTGRPVLVSRSDAGEIQALATFVGPSPSAKEQGTIRLLKNYHFAFATATGKMLLSLVDQPDVVL